jgi:hypothetical protein
MKKKIYRQFLHLPSIAEETLPEDKTILLFLFCLNHEFEFKISNAGISGKGFPSVLKSAVLHFAIELCEVRSVFLISCLQVSKHLMSILQMHPSLENGKMICKDARVGKIPRKMYTHSELRGSNHRSL